LPLVEAPVELLEAAAEAPAEAPVEVDAAADALDAADGELDDEHAAVTPTSNAAAAPAAGTDKDRFIPAPSCEGNPTETYGLMVQHPCHRCQEIRRMFF
jgi:hypothetical protein